MLFRSIVAASSLIAGLAGVGLTHDASKAAEVIAEETRSGMPLVFVEDFEQGANHWQPMDAESWKLVDSRNGKAFSVIRKSKYTPPHRSPLNIAIRKGDAVSDFVFEGDTLSTIRDYAHRDMCVVFGYQDPSHYYYVHLGKKTDDAANQIFIVDGAPRKKISTKTTEGTNWDDNWHHVKVTRDVKSGAIAIYFDDMENPVMTAEDKTFDWGSVGVGSFDDVGHWDNIKLWGRAVEGEKKERK